jgi:hypothetical protein
MAGQIEDGDAILFVEVFENVCLIRADRRSLLGIGYAAGVAGEINANVAF